jgi:hypothetical protein
MTLVISICNTQHLTKIILIICKILKIITWKMRILLILMRNLLKKNFQVLKIILNQIQKINNFLLIQKMNKEYKIL